MDPQAPSAPASLEPRRESDPRHEQTLAASSTAAASEAQPPKLNSASGSEPRTSSQGRPASGSRAPANSARSGNPGSRNPPRRAASNASRWATSSPAPSPPLAVAESAPSSPAQSRQNGFARPDMSRTLSATATRQPLGPPSPSLPASRTPSQTGKGRAGSPAPAKSQQNKPRASGGTNTSRWATSPTAAPSSAVTTQDRIDLPAPVAQSPSSLLPSSPLSAALLTDHEVPLPPSSFSQTMISPDHTVTPADSPASRAPETAPAPSPSRQAPSPRPNPNRNKSNEKPPPRDRTSTPSRSPGPRAPQPQLPPPVPSVTSTPSVPPSTATGPSPIPSSAPTPPVSLSPAPAGAATPQPRAPLTPRSLMPDRNRVSTGGSRKEKKSPEELEALMARMRLKNEEAMKKLAKAEEDRKAFEIVAEQERLRAEELARREREERERRLREERERKERTLELQKAINREREEAAQRKLALIQGRAWDAEKLDRERDPYGEGGSGRELQYPSHERRSRFEDVDRTEESDEHEGLSEAERRKKYGVANEEGWETVEHFEGRGRAQLVVNGI
ncbi:uncharacterized protein JCM15063_002675 [Sporobolomyces koalae]|uniref:uncharacterized protein n=1 Tax=Sporobolomyces koalae TaxID=500713 RepID=UPI00317AF9EF